jgi:hypothetical protein
MIHIWISLLTLLLSLSSPAMEQNGAFLRSSLKGKCRVFHTIGVKEK